MFTNLEELRGCLNHLYYNSNNAKRRSYYDASDSLLMEVMDPFSIDINSILSSKAIRRLENKTQVYPGASNSYVRDRMTHTLEIASYAQMIAAFLGLNPWLALAIALGHDLGHTPFGHFGEEKIAELSGLPFRHEILSVVIMQKIERKGFGLNCTYPVLTGVRFHSRGKGLVLPKASVSAEGNLVMYLDKLCYTFSDVNDAGRQGIDIGERLPWISKVFGRYQRERMQACLVALMEESARKGEISFEESETAIKFNELKGEMYRNIYPNHDSWKVAGDLLEAIYKALPYRYPDSHPGLLLAMMGQEEIISLQRPLTFSDRIPEQISLSIDEIYPHIKGREIDFTNPDLSWGE